MGSKKKAYNPIDDLIEQLAEKFKAIPNIELVQTDSTAATMFDFAVRRFAGMQAYKTLIAKTVMPAVNKSNFEMKEYARKSIYRELAPQMMEEIEENFYEMVRLSYVGMFHKYENYVYELINLGEKMVKQADKEGLTRYIREIFNFKFEDWLNSNITHRINWISNCIKHKDGYPVKENPPIEFMIVDAKRKIRLTKEQFISDVDVLLKQMEFALVMMKTFVIHMIAFHERDNSYLSKEFIEKQETQKKELEDKLKMLLQSAKAKTAVQVPESLKEILKNISQ